jgi:hypothetical protein
MARKSRAREYGGRTPSSRATCRQKSRAPTEVSWTQGADLVRVETVAQSAERGGLAGTGLAGDEAGAVGLDEVAEPGVKFVEPWRDEELLGRNLAVEGVSVEAEVGVVHHFPPL